MFKIGYYHMGPCKVSLIHINLNKPYPKKGKLKENLDFIRLFLGTAESITVLPVLFLLLTIFLEGFTQFSR